MCGIWRTNIVHNIWTNMVGIFGQIKFKIFGRIWLEIVGQIWLEISRQIWLEIFEQIWLEIFQKSFDTGWLGIPDYQGRCYNSMFWHLSKIYRATDKNLRMWVLRLWGCQGFSGSIRQPLGIGLFQRSQEMSMVDLHRPHLRGRFFYWLQNVWTNRGFQTPGLSECW